jgi:Leucine-rich repeat (LRR) protein
MFIKKDTRKIPQTLTDATARLSPESEEKPITELSFARRAPELSSGISIVIQPSYHPALQNLLQLSLYDCGLDSLKEIQQNDVVTFPKLEQLDIGRNPLLINDSLSDTFHTQFPSLKEVWADNCSFGPSIPDTLLQVKNFEVVRMTGNKLQSVQELDKYWPLMKVLALDGNEIQSAVGLGKLQHLEKLHLRGNKLTELEGVPSIMNAKLTLISLSSNQLTKLPDTFVEATSLKEVYLNGNQLKVLPGGLSKLGDLTKLNLAHNNIGHDVSDDEDALPADFVERFGMPNVITGECDKDETCVVLLVGNPLAEGRKKRHLEE